MIQGTPSDSLVDEQLTIELTGFEPNEQVTLWAQVTDENGQTWASYGRFETTDNGSVDLAEQAPLSGTYEGVDPMGLLWSMHIRGKVQVPYLEDDWFTVRFGVQRNETVVATTEITRRFISTDVTQHRVDEDGLVGAFFKPSGSEPRPGVLVLHGSEGEVPWVIGAMLASRGYASLALQYFSPSGHNGLPEALAGIPLEYCERAIDWLLAQSTVADGPVGVVGESKGGELALLLGSRAPQVGAVVGYVPSGVTWQGMDASGMITDGSSWTVAGEDVPFVPIQFAGSVREMIDWGLALLRGRPMAIDWLYRESVHHADRDRLEAATIRVEEIDGPVLLISGQDDELWPSPLLADIALQRLAAADHPHSFEHLSYEDAGHFITVPYQPAGHLDAWESLKLGGTPAGNAHAAADSWPRVLDTLAEGFR